MSANQIKLVVGTRVALCSRVVRGTVTFLRVDRDLGDARHNGFDYTAQSQALNTAKMRVRPKDFFKCSTSFVEPLIIN
jgi:hypothetical protein